MGGSAPTEAATGVNGFVSAGLSPATIRCAQHFECRNDVYSYGVCKFSQRDFGATPSANFTWWVFRASGAATAFGDPRDSCTLVFRHGQQFGLSICQQQGQPVFTFGAMVPSLGMRLSWCKWNELSQSTRRGDCCVAMSGTLVLTHQEDAATLQSMVTLAHPGQPYFGIGALITLFQNPDGGFYRRLDLHLPIPAHAGETVLQAPVWDFIPRGGCEAVPRFGICIVSMVTFMIFYAMLFLYHFSRPLFGFWLGPWVLCFALHAGRCTLMGRPPTLCFDVPWYTTTQILAWPRIFLLPGATFECCKCCRPLHSATTNP